MALFYPQQSGDFDLNIPLDKSSMGGGVEELTISLRYNQPGWCMSIWYEGKYLTQNQIVQPNIDLLAKFSAYKLGQFIVRGDPKSPDCFSNWPVEIGYA